jgi:ribosomal protein S18 acetylase RimI-like enzyme
MSISIRDARAADAETIVEFNARIALETEDEKLDPETVASGVRKVLDDRSLGRYWVAEADGEIVGQIMTTFEWSDWRNGMLWWIQSVYIRPDYRRRGVFSRLYRHVERLAREADEVVGLRLYVEKENERAQLTYRNLGMTMTGYRIMQVLF